VKIKSHRPQAVLRFETAKEFLQWTRNAYNFLKGWAESNLLLEGEHFLGRLFCLRTEPFPSSIRD